MERFVLYKADYYITKRLIYKKSSRNLLTGLEAY